MQKIQIGEVRGDSLLIRAKVGDGKLGDSSYEFGNTVPVSNPYVKCSSTGKVFTLSWEEIINLAIKAGVSEGKTNEST